MPPKSASHRNSVFSGLKSLLKNKDAEPSSSAISKSSKHDRANRQSRSLRRSSSADPALPPELFERIVYHLRDDAPMLNLCCYLNRAFRVFAQKLIFREIILDDRIQPHPTPPPPQRFLQLHAFAPHLAVYVHSLVIAADPSSRDTRPCWMLEDQHLLQVVRLMPNIERLTIRSAARNRKAIRWIDLAPSIRGAVWHILETQLLREVEFDGIEHLPLRIFDWCPRLERLAMSFCSPADSTHLAQAGIPLVPADVSRNKRRLKHLTLHHTTHRTSTLLGWFTSPQCPVSLTHLRRLDYWFCDDEESRMLTQLLGYCVNYLEYITLTPPLNASTVFAIRNLRQEPFVPRPLNIALHDCSIIKYFSFSMQLKKTYATGHHQNPTGFVSALPLLVKILSSLPKENRLKYVGINLKASRVEDTILEQLDWEELVSFLLSRQLSRFRQLRIETKGDDTLSKNRMVDILKRNSDLVRLLWSQQLILS